MSRSYWQILGMMEANRERRQRREEETRDAIIAGVMANPENAGLSPEEIAAKVNETARALKEKSK